MEGNARFLGSVMVEVRELVGVDTAVEVGGRKRVKCGNAGQMDCSWGGLILSCCLPWCRCAQRDDDDFRGGGRPKSYATTVPR
jgi:hypothetical protein